jgi:glycosyltransferase involved in cell wall biosynthesis
MVYYTNRVVLCPSAVYFYKNRENSLINKKLDPIREKLRSDNVHKSREISKEFMRVHKIKRHNKLYRMAVGRAGKTVCLNDPIEYGKIDKKISIIIPIYNAQSYLEQTLNSIRFQTYKSLEIVCVLDCPTDDSAYIINEIAKEDSRIKIVVNSQNMGLPITRNIGVDNATGEYIHFMDADDLINPDFYEIMINAAVKNDADVTACSVFYEKKPMHSIWFKKSEVLLSDSDKIKKTLVTVQSWAWRYLIRKTFWKSNNLSFPDLVPMEDKPVMIKAVFYSNKVVLCPYAVYFYKNRENSILNKNYDPIRKKRQSDNRHKSREISNEFMRTHKIKEPNKWFYSIKRMFM